MRPYSTGMNNISVSAAKSLIELTNTTDQVLVLLRATLGQKGSETSEQARVIIQRVSGTAATGTTKTPRPLNVSDPAASFTVKADCTVEPGTFDGDPLVDEGFNWISGFLWVPTPEDRIWVPPSGRVVLKITEAPAAALVMSAVLQVGEVG